MQTCAPKLGVSNVGQFCGFGAGLKFEHFLAISSPRSISKGGQRLGNSPGTLFVGNPFCFYFGPLWRIPRGWAHKLGNSPGPIFIGNPFSSCLCLLEQTQKEQTILVVNPSSSECIFTGILLSFSFGLLDSKSKKNNGSRPGTLPSCKT